MSIEAMKLAFESWARPKWTHREDFDQRIKAKPGTYNNFEVQAAWEAWQAALSQQPATGEPDGYVLVPIVPTREMTYAAMVTADSEWCYHVGHDDAKKLWASMLTANQAQEGGECLPIRGNQVTCSRGTGGCGIQHKGGE